MIEIWQLQYAKAFCTFVFSYIDYMIICSFYTKSQFSEYLKLKGNQKIIITVRSTYLHTLKKIMFLNAHAQAHLIYFIIIFVVLFRVLFIHCSRVYLKSNKLQNSRTQLENLPKYTQHLPVSSLTIVSLKQKMEE